MIYMETGAIGAVSGGAGMASMGAFGGAGVSSVNMTGGDIGNKVGAVSGDFSNIMNVQNNNNIDLGNMSKLGGTESAGTGKVSGGGGGLQVNQTSFSSVTVIEQNTEININFGDTEKAMDQVFDMFSGKGQDETLFDLLLAIFEKQQEMIMELFQKLLEATGMAAMTGQG